MKKVILSVMAVAFMVSCGKDKNAPANKDNQIRFSGRTLSVDTRAALGDLQTVLPVGGTVGIFGVKHTGTMVWPSTLTGYHTNLQNAKGNVDATDQVKISYTPFAYYPTGSNERLNFYAYYPYSTLPAPTITAGSAPTIGVSQPSNPSEHVDYLWAKPVVNQVRQTTAVNLEFNHAFGLVRVYVQKNAEMVGALTLSSVTLTTSTEQSGTMNIETGAIAREAGGSTVYTLTNLEKTIPVQATGGGNTNAELADANARFLYIPASTITELNVTINGMAYIVTGQTITTPVAGEAMNINITVQSAGIIFTASVAAWVPGEDTEITPD